LVAHWGSEGGAVLSLPTKEYFQSSGWVEDKPSPLRTTGPEESREASGTEVQSVRSGSEFWADGRSRTPSSRAFTSLGGQYMSDTGDESEKGRKSYLRIMSHTRQGRESHYTTEDDDNDSQGTEGPGGGQDADVDVDAVDYNLTDVNVISTT